MAEKVLALAGQKEITVNRTYDTTLTPSSAASVSWDIPANCVRAHVVTDGLVFSSNATFSIYLEKTSDGTDSTNDYFFAFQSDASTTAFEGSAASSWVSSTFTNSDNIAFDLSSLNLSSATGKTTMAWNISRKTTTDEVFSFGARVATTAEANDKMRFECNLGSMTGDIRISYTIAETQTI